MMTAAALGDLQRRRLRWRARRGLLENDVLLSRFFDRHPGALDADQVNALAVLLELPDKDLLDLLLARTEPAGEVNTPSVCALLAMMRTI
jgi:antitoxin CptB